MNSVSINEFAMAAPKGSPPFGAPPGALQAAECAGAFDLGHRLRAALSTSAWAELGGAGRRSAGWVQAGAPSIYQL